MQEQSNLAGYSFLPFLLAALLAIFPLSIIEAVIFSGLIISTFIASKYLSGTLFSFSTFEDIWLLMLLAGIAMWAQLAQLFMLLRLYREATRDTLTGLVNRRVLAKWTEVEIHHAEIDGSPLSVLLFDLDRFKRVNDEYGHLTGDAVLQSFAKILEEEVFDSNLLGRYGGEEFLAILPNNEIGPAVEMAERIRLACHDVITKGLEGEKVSFTVSVGVSQFHPGEDSSSLLHRVDKCLYQAKAMGRDQVVHTDS
jgi:diguanylate cyclase (GGDEF)-like protein